MLQLDTQSTIEQQDKTKQKQQGFSLIELVIVVVILALLAATAIPRFLDVATDAEDATTEGVAGGFATGVGLVRAQWEVEGRPDNFADNSNQAFVTLDGVEIGVDPNTGYPTGSFDQGAPTNTLDTSMTSQRCFEIFDRILQSPSSITTSFDANIANFRYYVNAVDGAGTGNADACYFYLVQTIRNQDNAPTDSSVGNGFIYDTRVGRTTVFSNN